MFAFSRGLQLLADAAQKNGAGYANAKILILYKTPLKISSHYIMGKIQEKHLKHDIWHLNRDTKEVSLYSKK